STCASWNSRQAVPYHLVVSPTGSQVPSQRGEKDDSTTVAIMASRVMMKKPTTTQIAVIHSLAPTDVSRIIVQSPRMAAAKRSYSPLAARGRAAIEQVSDPQHRHDDDQLHQRHDHGNGRGHRV